MIQQLHIIATHSLASVREQLQHAGLADDSAAAYIATHSLASVREQLQHAGLADDSAAAYYRNTQRNKCEREAPACRASR